jgi:hypothetical protein
MTIIPLNLGRWKRTPPTRFAVVSDRDAARVRRHRWSAVRSGKHWYAQTMVKRDGGWRVLKMHRLIKGGSGLIDHRNLNGLDNRRCNLRFATRKQNAANSHGHRDRKSAYKGVCFETFTGLWLAQLTVDGRLVFKARFHSESKAGRAYLRAARRHNGSFARQ